MKKVRSLFLRLSYLTVIAQKNDMSLTACFSLVCSHEEAKSNGAFSTFQALSRRDMIDSPAARLP